MNLICVPLFSRTKRLHNNIHNLQTPFAGNYGIIYVDMRVILEVFRIISKLNFLHLASWGRILQLDPNLRVECP